MVFGNMGNNSAKGVGFTRDASTEKNILNREYFINAQGEDVVAGIRTPQQITLIGLKTQADYKERLEKTYSHPQKNHQLKFIILKNVQEKLEQHFKDMQDIEFTIQN